MKRRLLPDFDTRWVEPVFRDDIMAVTRAPEAEPSIVGASAHLLGVVEAYHAAYASRDGSQTEVFAVTFNNATLADLEPLSATMNPPAGLTRRFVWGSTVAVVSGRRSDCFRAVTGHIGSLKFPRSSRG